MVSGQTERLVVIESQVEYPPFILPKGYTIGYYPRQFEDGTIYDNLRLQMARYGLTAKRKDLQPDITHLPFMYRNILPKEAHEELLRAKKHLPGSIFMIACPNTELFVRTFKELLYGPINILRFLEDSKEEILVAYKGIEGEDPRLGCYNLNGKDYCIVKNAVGVQIYPPIPSVPPPTVPFLAETA